MILQNIYIRRTIQVIIILAILLFTWHVGKDWLRPKIIKGLGGYTKSEVTRKVDTLESHFDTLYFKYKEVITELDLKDREEIKDFTYVPKTDVSQSATTISNKGKVLITPSTPPQRPVSLPFAYKHENDVSDTLISGKVITYINPSDCNIVQQTLQYTPKFPIIVKEYIPIKETITETLSDKPRAYFGIGVLGTTNKDIGGQILYQTPSKWQYGVGYIKYDNSILLPDKQNTGTITISITKLF